MKRALCSNCGGFVSVSRKYESLCDNCGGKVVLIEVSSELNNILYNDGKFVFEITDRLIVDIK